MHWRVQFPTDKVTYPSGMSDEDQAIHFRGISKEEQDKDRSSRSPCPYEGLQKSVASVRFTRLFDT